MLLLAEPRVYSPFPGLTERMPHVTTLSWHLSPRGVDCFRNPQQGVSGGSGRDPARAVSKSLFTVTVPASSKDSLGPRVIGGRGSFQNNLPVPWALALSNPVRGKTLGGEKPPHGQASPRSLLCQPGFAWTPGTPDAEGSRAPGAAKALGARRGADSPLSSQCLDGSLAPRHPLPGRRKWSSLQTKGDPHTSLCPERSVPGAQLQGGCPASRPTWEAAALRDSQQQQQQRRQQQRGQQCWAPHGAPGLRSAPRRSASRGG